MKNYSDLLDTSLQVRVELELIGSPAYTLTINGITKSTTTAIHWVALRDLFNIEVKLHSKDYHGPETAVNIVSIDIDGINIVPTYTHLATYTNDHNYTAPTSYIGFVGKWALTFDRPFYQWLHQATGQGWLLEP